MKRFISAILAALFVMSMISACTADKPADNGGVSQSVTDVSKAQNKETEDNAENTENTENEKNTENTANEETKDNSANNGFHTVYFKDSSKSSKVSATFFNSLSGKSEEVEMEKTGEDSESFTFSCEGDTTAYNMAYFTYGDKQTEEFAFNNLTSGWYQTEDDFFPYTEGEKIDFTPKFDDVTLNGYGYDQKIHIWKPDDYDASSDEKYSTVYVLDGQSVADFDIVDYEPMHCPGVIEQIKASMSAAGKKAIVVAVETYLNRDFVLTPDLEASADEKENDEDDRDYDSMNGSEFADFAANKLVPYVQKNYNVYTDALHTSVTGNSLGGLESFYITIEYPETFGTVGALSPSFWIFDDTQWRDYLEKKSFNADSPFLYLYTGPAGKDTDPDVTNMYNRLKEMGYPEDKLVLHLNEKGTHSGEFWRSVFSEYLTAMFYQRIEPLQQ